MPYLKTSAYRAPVLFRNGHVSTIYSGAVRKTLAPAYQREKLELPDGDFLLLDYLPLKTKKAVILCHGLGGDSTSSYNNTAAHYFLENDFSVFAWNNRGCGGEKNRLPQLYHHASISDLEYIVKYVGDLGFEEIYLLGFSLGGAQILSYFGRKKVDARVKSGVAVSSPIELKSSAKKIEKGFSKVYLKRFVTKIRERIEEKAIDFPDLLDLEEVRKIVSFEDVARQFIVPVHRFDNLADYYKRASPGYSLDGIQTPVLILNAWDDPIIGDAAFPIDFAKSNPYVFLETPSYGGHCAFPLYGKKHCFSEARALEFFRKTN